MFLGPSRGDETVLVAEDEPTVQRLIRDVLENKGYRVLLADDGESALKLIREMSGKIHLLITDVVMPRMNGRDLAAQLRARYSHLKVLYISGYIGKASVKIAELGPATSFLSKPFSSEALARKIRLLLDSPPPDHPAAPPPDPHRRSPHRHSL
jgi:CheY-like chemotaxis protein